MAIQKIKIENFTVFENIEIDFCDGVNIFIGENGTGKTHLLKLLYVSAKLSGGDSFSAFDGLFGKHFYPDEVTQFSINDNKPHHINASRLIESSQENETANAKNHTSAIADFTSVNRVILSKPVAYIHAEISSNSIPVFIPAKEVLSMSNLPRVDDEYKRSLNIDATIIDIIEKAKKLMPDKVPDFALKIAAKLEKEIGGRVFFDEKEETFWIYKTNGEKVPFSSEAEGFRKLGLLWQLIMNKSIKEGRLLLWDEPEANLNPRLIPG